TDRWHVTCESWLKSSEAPAKAQRRRGTNSALITAQTCSSVVSNVLPPAVYHWSR
ncbi:hypothetical protein HAX54_047521, partial [Datura stramonium]|nr:hypothetical protein [Datura stramonium]